MKNKKLSGILNKVFAPLLTAAVLTVSASFLLSDVSAANTVLNDGYALDLPSDYAENYVIEINKFADLAEIAQNVNNGTNDYRGMTIVLKADVSAGTASTDSYRYGFAPIGTKEHPFRGVFDGCGHTVTLCLVKTSSYGPKEKDTAGLFGYAENAIIRNVVVDGKLQSTGKTGAIAAYAVSSTIINCINFAPLRGSSIGGIAASVSGTEDAPCTIANCAVSDVTFTPDMPRNYTGGFGGIVGRLEDKYSYIRNCFSYFSVNSSEIGGICGYASGTDFKDRIENSYYISASAYARAIVGKNDAMKYYAAIDISHVDDPQTDEESLEFIMNRYINEKGYGSSYGEWAYDYFTGFFTIESRCTNNLKTISSPDDWNALASESQKNSVKDIYLLTSDLSGVTNMLGTYEKPFSGVLLGAGHTVSVSISSTTERTGLISYAENAKIYDITVKGSINGARSVGSIVGEGKDVYISGCICQAKISGKNDVGGIIGWSRGTTRIENCIADWESNGASIETGTGCVTCGGIVGLFTDDSVVEWCSSYTAIKSFSYYVGGIVGCMQKNSFVRACGSYGRVEGTHHIGGIVGCVEGGKGVENCYSQAIVMASENNAGGILTSLSNGMPIRSCINVGLVISNDANTLYPIANTTSTELCYALDLTDATTAKYIDDGTFADYFNFELKRSDIENPIYWAKSDVAAFALAETCPKAVHSFAFLEDETSLISTADEFELVSTILNFDTMNNHSWKLGADIILGAEKRISAVFDGVFDGDGHTITLSSTKGGLFTEVCGKVMNLTVSGSVSGDTVGAIADRLVGGTIENCRNTATVTGNTTAGGIVGSINDGDITDCSNSGSVTGNGFVGGIVGSINDGDITNCSNSGSVTGSENVGGIVGSATNCNIRKCSNTGKVNGNRNGNTGGIVGLFNGGNIMNCSVSGEVNGYGNTGGIFGHSTGNVGVDSCENNAPIHSNGDCSGGIGGKAEKGKISIVLCDNRSYVRTEWVSTYYFGGILGCTEAETRIEYCCNYANVIYPNEWAGATTGCGGILGAVVGSESTCIMGCGNFANVTCDSPDVSVRRSSTSGMYIGGIVGSCDPAAAVTIDYCVNDANVYGWKYIGGIVGGMGNAVITDCYNAAEACASLSDHGTISGTAAASFAGSVFTSNNDTFQNGGAIVRNTWTYGLADPTGTLEFILNRNHRIASAPYAWKIAADGHSEKGFPDTVKTKPEYLAVSPLVINDDNSVRFFGFLLENGCDFSGEYISLEADITIRTPLIPDGTEFHGVFDGNNHTITLGTDNDGRGVFGNLSNASILNLKVTGTIKAGELRGGFAQTASAASFENCVSSVTIGDPDWTCNECGGFVGRMTDNCTIVGGRSTAAIYTSTMYSGNKIGGFVGSMTGGEVRDVEFDSDRNKSFGILSGNEYIGGVIGYASGVMVTNATVKPIVSGTRYVGGIIGGGFDRTFIYSSSVTTGTDKNLQWITASTGSVGGIAGVMSNSEIFDSKSFALVYTPGTAAGGIVGTFYAPGGVHNCTVEGGVGGFDRIGGVMGEALVASDGNVLTAVIEKCTISTKYPTESWGYVAIDGVWSVGGVLGYTNTYTYICNCLNTSAVWSSCDYLTSFVGGIVAYSASPEITVVNCVNEGYLESSGWAGGIVCFAEKANIGNCVNSGTMRRATYFGGIAVQINKSDYICNCVNIGTSDLSYSSSPVVIQITNVTWETIPQHCAYKDSTITKGYWEGGIFCWPKYVPLAEMAVFLNNGIGEFAPLSAEWLKWDHNDNTRLLVHNPTASDLIGNGTAESPYIIKNGDEFITLGQLINMGEIPSNIHIRLENSITLLNHVPLGTKQRPFKGEFDGASNTVTVTMKDRMTSNNGIFGYTDGANIHDFNVAGEITGVGSESAAIVGRANNTTVSNCKVGASFEIASNATDCGIIIGKATGKTKIINCCNNSKKLVGVGKRYGGICGSANGDTQIINCINNPDIGVWYDCGGIVGTVSGNTTIENCINYGSITNSMIGTGRWVINNGENIGGIVGNATGTIKIINCLNKGKKFGNFYRKCGGICGNASGTIQITECINYAESASCYQEFGGIVSSVSGNITLEKCANYANIEFATYECCGVVAKWDGSGSIISCRNFGDIRGGLYDDSHNVAGIVGALNSGVTIRSCMNNGNIILEKGGGNGCAGIVGIADSTSCTISGCTNYGNIEAPNMTEVGGIAGYSVAKISCCVNNGSISGKDCVGGICGRITDLKTRGGKFPQNYLYMAFCVNSSSKISAETDNFGSLYGYFNNPVVERLDMWDNLSVSGVKTGGGNDTSNEAVCKFYEGNITYQILDHLYQYTTYYAGQVEGLIPGIGADGLPTTVIHKGAGTESDPYIIESADDLVMLAFQLEIGNVGYNFAGDHFKLGCDIVQTDLLIPIGTRVAFAGIFDGNGKTIEMNATLKDMKPAGSGNWGEYVYKIRNNLALFANTDGATIKNLRISGYVDGSRNTVSGQNGGANIGAIVGNAKNSHIINCQVDAFVRGEKAVGGIVGSATATSFENCICRSVVNGADLVGGIVGEIIGDCSFVNCISSADTSAGNGTAGAFAGTMEKAGSVYWMSNFLVNGRTAGKAIALGNSPVFASLTAGELVKRQDLAPHYRVQETGICLTLFYTDDPHSRLDMRYPSAVADYEHEGSVEHFRCNACGKYYTDRAYRNEITDYDKWYRESCITPILDRDTTFELGVWNSNEIDYIRFRTAEEFLKYLSDNRNTEFSHIVLGGDITTSFPILINRANIYLHGHTWMTTGSGFDASIIDKSPVYNNLKYTEYDEDENDMFIRYNGGDGSVIHGEGGTIASDGTYHSLIKFNNLTVYDTTFRDADARVGAAIWGDPNTAETLEVFNCKFINCHAQYAGGAIYMSCDNKDKNVRLQLDKNEFTNCSADEYGGAIYCVGKKYVMVRFLSGTFRNCSAHYGGAIYADSPYMVRVYGDEPNPSRCQIIDCHANARGGAVYLASEGIAKLSGVEMIGNYASNAYSPKYAGAECMGETCEGGGAFFDAKEAVSYANAFSMNSAGFVGGAISCGESTKNLKLDNSRFHLNVIGKGGVYGGYEISQVYGNIEFKNVIMHPIVYPDAASWGGTGWWIRSSIYIDPNSPELHINNGITGASAFDNVSLASLIAVSFVGVAAIAGVAIFVIKRKKKKQTPVESAA